MEILNRKAKHDYFIDEALECGIVLKGTEIKSIRKGSANLKDCYARIKDGEVFRSIQNITAGIAVIRRKSIQS